MSNTHRAAFLDRDGTLVEDLHYLSDPGAVRLLPHVGESVRRLNDAGVLVVVVTNQSGIARGLITEAQYEAIRSRLQAILRDEGARIDATYHCPHHPDIDGTCECRKPGTGMYRRAAAELGIDLKRSLYVGDRFRDVSPGIELGGMAFLVPSPSSPGSELEDARRCDVLADSLQQAVDRFLES